MGTERSQVTPPPLGVGVGADPPHVANPVLSSPFWQQSGRQPPDQVFFREKFPELSCMPGKISRRFFAVRASTKLPRGIFLTMYVKRVVHRRFSSRSQPCREGVHKKIPSRVYSNERERRQKQFDLNRSCSVKNLKKKQKYWGVQTCCFARKRFLTFSEKNFPTAGALMRSAYTLEGTLEY